MRLDLTPRALTADELRDMLLAEIRMHAEAWATYPGKTDLERCQGAAFSALTVLDGMAGLPAFDLVARPHPDDKQFHMDDGENWIEDGTTISDMLHERWHR